MNFLNHHPLLQNFVAIIVVFCFVALLASLHAFSDAVNNLRRAEKYYNKEPRLKQAHKRLAWTGRVISFFLLKRYH